MSSVQLNPTQFPSKTIHSVGFVGGNRGDLHVQFKDKAGQLSSRGLYKDVPRALFNALERDRKPGSVIAKSIKGHFEWFSWEAPEIIACRENPDLSLPDNLFIPADTPNTVEAIDAVIDSQRIEIQKGGLFE